MTDTQARILILAGFCLVAPVGIYHRLRANTSEQLDRRQEGWLVLLTLRPFAGLFLLGTLAFLINPTWMEWASTPLPAATRWLGVALGLLAAGLLIWTFRSLGHNLTDTVVTRHDATLITHGPYRFVRHPFYLAFLLTVVAHALVTANAFLAVTGLAAFAAIVARTSIEEAKLIEKFGQDYRDYQARTGRFFPRPLRNQRSQEANS